MFGGMVNWDEQSRFWRRCWRACDPNAHWYDASQNSSGTHATPSLFYGYLFAFSLLEALGRTQCQPIDTGGFAGNSYWQCTNYDPGDA